MYSKTYMEHFAAPKNIGEIENSDSTCTVKNEEGGCFDTVQAFAKIENNVILDFKYRLKACSGTITAFSLISTMLIGKTVEEARSITFEEMDGLLGGVPEKKSHSLRLAIEARDKIIDLKDKQGNEKMKITKEMSITEILREYPQTHGIFVKYNLGCIGCMAASFESLEDGLIAHGIKVDDFMTEINKTV